MSKKLKKNSNFTNIFQIILNKNQKNYKKIFKNFKNISKFFEKFPKNFENFQRISKNPQSKKITSERDDFQNSRQNFPVPHPSPPPPRPPPPPLSTHTLSPIPPTPTVDYGCEGANNLEGALGEQPI